MTDPNSADNYLVPPEISEPYFRKIIVQQGERGQRILEFYIDALENIRSRNNELLAIGRYRAAKVLGLGDHTSAAVLTALCDALEEQKSERT